MKIFSLCLALSLISAGPILAQETSEVYVVHGIPGVTVDVYVNGNSTLPGFTPGTVAGPIALPAGSYLVQITAAGNADLGLAILSKSVEVPAGKNLSLVAHLDGSGNPALSAFENDISELGTGRGRLIIRHVAAAPEVDVLLLKRWRLAGYFNDLENGEGASKVLAEGSYDAYVLGSKSHKKVAGPLPIEVMDGEVRIVYAVGSLANGTFGVLTQNILAAPRNALISVVHAVPGLTVDVFLNGDLALPGFTPKTITDPISLKPGKYAVAVAPAGAGIAAAVIQAEVEVTPGLDASIVAHLDANGGPTASVFVNDISSPGFARGRVVVRHTAAAPAVDVRLTRYRRPAGELAGITNGMEASAELRISRYKASVFPAGGDTSVLGPIELTVKPGTLTTIYALGSLSNGSLDLLATERRISIPRHWLNWISH